MLSNQLGMVNERISHLESGGGEAEGQGGETK
jgi:hypothetical protein